MTIKIKKEVEESLEVKLPFACVEDSMTCIVTEESIIKVNNNLIVKYDCKDMFYEREVAKAAALKAIPLEQAYERLERVIESFQLLVA